MNTRNELNIIQNIINKSPFTISQFKVQLQSSLCTYIHDSQKRNVELLIKSARKA